MACPVLTGRTLGAAVLAYSICTPPAAPRLLDLVQERPGVVLLHSLHRERGVPVARMLVWASRVPLHVVTPVRVL